MKRNYQDIGHKVKATVIGSKRNCTIGMEKGEEFDLSVHQCGDFCGYFYHNIFGAVYTLQFAGKLPRPTGDMQRADKPDMLQFGGTFSPGKDYRAQIWDCPNPHKRVQIELRRIPMGE